ncbi:MAG TPA: extracellular solute-binding protein, partial [Solirubrobacteraceae bacterium]|nr:extracellular solute-binding protein [Solirubrobacteraceae bacterium]
MTIRRTAIACVAALAAVAAGCGGGDGGDDPAGGAITVWTLETEPDRVAATRAIVAGFTRATDVRVTLVPVDENRLPTLVTSAAASGRLPDVMSLPLGLAHAYASEDILDTAAAQAVVDELGADTFAEGALKLVNRDGVATAVPSDGWGQLLIYRKDLFDAAGLRTPDTLDAIRAAAQRLDRGGKAGIALATAPGDAFTEQSFEYFALANGCELVDAGGNPALRSPECIDTFRRYAELASKYSLAGPQDVDSTRATYFAGRAAMIVWSPFLLDAMAGLRDDVTPSCPECRADPAFLARHSGIVTALSGPGGERAEYGEISTWGISADGNVAGAKAFAEYMLSDGYVRWLAISPQGKFPARTGDESDPRRFVEAWNGLESGVDRKAPLSRFYSAQAIAAIADGAESFERWGFEQGQGA